MRLELHGALAPVQLLHQLGVAAVELCLPPEEGLGRLLQTAPGEPEHRGVDARDSDRSLERSHGLGLHGGDAAELSPAKSDRCSLVVARGTAALLAEGFLLLHELVDGGVDAVCCDHVAVEGDQVAVGAFERGRVQVVSLLA